jgi:plasmid stabilization system protein ParE
MRRRLILGPVAEDEFREAIAWYERQRKGLGKRFRLAVREALQQIRSIPESQPVVYQPDVRRALVDVFPYIVYYRVLVDGIRVVSIFHTSRDPKSWQMAADDDIAETES